MDSCRIEGTINRIDEGVAFIETIPESACSGCGGKILCGSAKTRILKVKAPSWAQKGQPVTVAIPGRISLLFTFTLYMLAVITGIGAAWIVMKFLGSETAAALVFLAVSILWLTLSALAMKSYAAARTGLHPR